MKLAVIIPAAGTGSRFGDGDKLGQDLGGRPLLIRTVEIFTKRDEVAAVVVAGPPASEAFDAFKDKYGSTLAFLGGQVVAGGTIDRWETVRNALAAVPDDCTHIAVHDAARPCVTNELINRLVEAARQYPAVIPGVPLRDTIKRVAGDTATVDAAEDDAIADSILGDAGKVTVEVKPVAETIDRRNLTAIQTPQIFDADLLRRAYAQEDLTGLTDDASVIERFGEPVYVVEGETTNIKVTTPQDIRLVRAILGVKPPAERPVHKRF